MLRRLLNSLHIHTFITPIHSMYSYFSGRKIIYECRCGERKSFDVRRAYGDAFPIPTGMADRKVFKEILNNNLSETSKVFLAIDYKIIGNQYGGNNMIGKKFYHLLPDTVCNF